MHCGAIFQPEFLALKHKRLILGHLWKPVCGFSMMGPVSICAVWPTENWLGSSLNKIQGWTTVRESYSPALEQGPLVSRACGNGYGENVWNNVNVFRRRRRLPFAGSFSFMRPRPQLQVWREGDLGIEFYFFWRKMQGESQKSCLRGSVKTQCAVALASWTGRGVQHKPNL